MATSCRATFFSPLQDGPFFFLRLDWLFHVDSVRCDQKNDAHAAQVTDWTVNVNVRNRTKCHDKVNYQSLSVTMSMVTVTGIASFLIVQHFV